MKVSLNYFAYFANSFIQFYIQLFFMNLTVELGIKDWIFFLLVHYAISFTTVIES